VRATARDGRTIDVRRRWLPWKPRLRDVDGGGDAGGFDLGGGDDLAGVAVVLVIFLLLLFFPVVLAVALLAGEVLVLLLLLPLFLLARVVPVLPWTVEARHEGTLVGVEKVRGWHASQQRIQEIVTAYERSTDDPFALTRR
jgi:hypothetical protein